MSGIRCFTEISPRFEFWKTLNNLTHPNMGVFLHWFIYQTNSQCGLRICPAQCWAWDPRGAGRHGPCPTLPWEDRQTNQVPGQLGNGAEMARERAGGRAGGMREALSPGSRGGSQAEGTRVNTGTQSVLKCSAVGVSFQQRRSSEQDQGSWGDPNFHLMATLKVHILGQHHSRLTPGEEVRSGCRVHYPKPLQALPRAEKISNTWDTPETMAGCITSGSQCRMKMWGPLFKKQGKCL